MDGTIRPAVDDGHLQRSGHELGALVGRNPPTEDPAAQDV
jgi:hypothetical protein